MRPLTKKDMYNKEGVCVLPRYSLKKYRNRSKYNPEIEDKKHEKNING